jgi:flagellar export protein FliJ
VNRYRFRLDSVLRARRAQEERARQELAQANLRLRTAMDVHRRESQRYAEITLTVGALDNVEFHRQRAVAELAAATVEAARVAMDAAATEAATAYSAWTEAARLVAALERLDDRRRAEHRAEVLRGEVAVADDLTAARVAAERATVVAGSRSGAGRVGARA